MSFVALRWAQRVRTGSPARKAILFALAQFADEAESCFPSQARIAEITELSERTVRGALAELEAMKLIERKPRRDKQGRRTSDRFVLLVREPGEIQPAAAAGGEPANRQETTEPTGSCCRVIPTRTPSSPQDPSGPCGEALPSSPRVVVEQDPPRRGSRLSIEHLPNPWRAFCISERPDLDPERVFASFRDYWIALPGKDGRKLDWLATWRNWVRKERKPHGHSPQKNQAGIGHRTFVDAATEIFYRSRAEGS